MRCRPSTISKTVCSDTVAAAAQEVHRDALEGGMGKNENRCWPGYEPVEGKRQGEQGSCRPKAKGKLTAGEKEFRSERAEQLAKWKKAHPGSPIQRRSLVSQTDRRDIPAAMSRLLCAVSRLDQ